MDKLHGGGSQGYGVLWSSQSGGRRKAVTVMTPKLFCMLGLNSCAGLVTASRNCSQLQGCLALNDRSVEKRLNHAATYGVLDQQFSVRFIRPTWGMSGVFEVTRQPCTC